MFTIENLVYGKFDSYFDGKVDEKFNRYINIQVLLVLLTTNNFICNFW